MKYMAEGLSEEEAKNRLNQELSKCYDQNLSYEQMFTKLVQGKEPENTPAKQQKLDPDLEKPVILVYKADNEKRDYLHRELEKLAEVSGFNVMFESFRISESSSNGNGSERKLSEIIEQIASENRLDWIKEGNTLRFRLKDWAERRTWEVPDEWITQWRKVLETKFELDLDTRADMALKLTDEQLEHSVVLNQDADRQTYEDPALAGVFLAAGANDIKRSRKLLEFYGKLTPQQKQRLWTEEGLPMEEIPFDQWPEFPEGILKTWNSQTEIYGASFFLKRHDASTDQDYTIFGIKATALVKGIPLDLKEKERFRASLGLSPDELEKAANGPATITVGYQVHSGGESYRKWVKRALEEMRKEHEKAGSNKEA
jgi:hypothetical protein